MPKKSSKKKPQKRKSQGKKQRKRCNTRRKKEEDGSGMKTFIFLLKLFTTGLGGWLVITTVKSFIVSKIGAGAVSILLGIFLIFIGVSSLKEDFIKIIKKRR